MQTQPTTPMTPTGESAAWLPFMLNPERERASDNPTARMAEAVFDSLVTTFTAPLLSTRDPDELDSQIDAILDDPEFGPRYLTFVKLVCGLAKAPRVEAAVAADLTETWALKLGRENVPKLQGVVSLAGTLFSAHLRLLARQQGTTNLSMPSSLLGFLEDWHTPASIKRIQMDSLRAEVAMLAISAALHDPHPLPRWVITHLLATGEHGYWNHLRLVASFTDAEVSTAVVPFADRIDLAALGATNLLSRLSTELLTLKHLDSKESVFSPFGEIAPDDD